MVASDQATTRRTESVREDLINAARRWGFSTGAMCAILGLSTARINHLMGSNTTINGRGKTYRRADMITPAEAARLRDAIDAIDSATPRRRQLPATRGECPPPGDDGRRVCPYVSCRHHLAQSERHTATRDSHNPLFDINPLFLDDRGGLRLDLEVYCALDAIDGASGELTLEMIGDMLGLTRERIRQVEISALGHLLPVLEIDVEALRDAPIRNHGEHGGSGLRRLDAPRGEVAPVRTPEMTPELIAEVMAAGVSRREHTDVDRRRGAWLNRNGERKPFGQQPFQEPRASRHGDATPAPKTPPPAPAEQAPAPEPEETVMVASTPRQHPPMKTTGALFRELRESLSLNFQQMATLVGPPVTTAMIGKLERDLIGLGNATGAALLAWSGHTLANVERAAEQGARLTVPATVIREAAEFLASPAAAPRPVCPPKPKTARDTSAAPAEVSAALPGPSAAPAPQPSPCVQSLQGRTILRLGSGFGHATMRAVTAWLAQVATGDVRAAAELLLTEGAALLTEEAAADFRRDIDMLCEHAGVHRVGETF